MKINFLYLFIVLFNLATFGSYADNRAIDYKLEMLNLLEKIKNNSPENFTIIQQNALDLYYNGQTLENTAYLKNIDGISQESIFYGDPSYGSNTPEDYTNFLVSGLKQVKLNGKQIITTNYVNKPEDATKASNLTKEAGFINYNALDRELSEIPDYRNNLAYHVGGLRGIQNVLYYINPAMYSTKAEMLAKLGETDQDLIVIDAFFGDSLLSETDIENLKIKVNDGKRQVVAYLSIGEAEDYRYYWKPEWSTNPPYWLGKENPNWAGNYKVLYWEDEWQKIVLDYLNTIIASGYDGVFLDTVDSYNYYIYSKSQ